MYFIMDISENVSINDDIRFYLEKTYKQPLVSAYLYKKEGVLVYNGIQIPVNCANTGVCTLETPSGETVIFQGGRRRRKNTKRRKTKRRNMRSTRSRRVRH
jgi:hypothetical protein